MLYFSGQTSVFLSYILFSSKLSFQDKLSLFSLHYRQFSTVPFRAQSLLLIHCTIQVSFRFNLCSRGSQWFQPPTLEYDHQLIQTQRTDGLPTFSTIHDSPVSSSGYNLLVALEPKFNSHHDQPAYLTSAACAPFFANNKFHVFFYLTCSIMMVQK